MGSNLIKSPCTRLNSLGMVLLVLYSLRVPVSNGEARWVHHLRASNQLKVSSLVMLLHLLHMVYGGGSEMHMDILIHIEKDKQIMIQFLKI